MRLRSWKWEVGGLGASRMRERNSLFNYCDLDYFHCGSCKDGDSHFVILFFRVSRTMAFPVLKGFIFSRYVTILSSYYSILSRWRGGVPYQIKHPFTDTCVTRCGCCALEIALRPQPVWYMKRRPRNKQEDPWIWQGERGGIEREKCDSSFDSANNT